MKLSIIIESSTIITAHSPKNSKDENSKALGSLIKDLSKLQATFRFKSGRWRGIKETALLVSGLTEHQARELMFKYNQESVIHNNKLIKSTDCYELV